MWRNYLWTFDSMEEARKKVKSLVKARASFKGGPFLESDVSCRRGLPEEEVKAARRRRHKRRSRRRPDEGKEVQPLFRNNSMLNDNTKQFKPNLNLIHKLIKYKINLKHIPST